MRKNKKGFATALVDFYATVIIVLIIVVFFFVLHAAGQKVTFSIQDAEDTYGLEASQIALLYTETPVETSQGTMDFGTFASIAATDQTIQDEFSSLTKQFFDHYCSSVLDTVVSAEIYLVKNQQEQQILRHTACNELTIYATSSPPSSLLLPLQKPGDFIRIDIRTITLDKTENLFTPTHKL